MKAGEKHGSARQNGAELPTSRGHGSRPRGSCSGVTKLSRYPRFQGRHDYSSLRNDFSVKPLLVTFEMTLFSLLDRFGLCEPFLHHGSYSGQSHVKQI